MAFSIDNRHAASRFCGVLAIVIAAAFALAFFAGTGLMGDESHHLDMNDVAAVCVAIGGFVVVVSGAAKHHRGPDVRVDIHKSTTPVALPTQHFVARAGPAPLLQVFRL